MASLTEQQLAPTRPGATRPGVGPLRLVLVPLLVMAAAAAVSAALGFAIYGVLDSANSSDDGWESLGYAILALGVAALAALTISIVGVIVAVRRLFLPGHRVAPAVLAIFGPLLPLTVASGVSTFVPEAAPPAVMVCSLAGLITPSLAFLWYGSDDRTQGVLLRVVGAIGAVTVVGSLVLYVVSDAREDQVADDLPLVLFEGTTPEAGYPEWRLDVFGRTTIRSETAFAPEGHEAYLKYFSDTGVTFLTMRTQVGECAPTEVRGYTCQVTGSLPAGELRAYTYAGEFPSFPDSEEFLVLVYPDGSGVSVNVDGSDVPAQDILTRLQRIDRERFEAATGVELELQ